MTQNNSTDRMPKNYSCKCAFSGVIHDTINFVEDLQLLNPELWFKFVEQHRLHTDTDNGWRGEYWGKMMRGACLVYSYTQNSELYNILTKTVCDMLETPDEYGRISSYPYEKEFTGWDIWGRKYVLLGLQYYLDICTDTILAKKIIDEMCHQVDLIIDKIGEEDGKKPITDATSHWRGLNSSSILEPIVKLYNLTREKRYFDFAKYIVDNGGTSVENIFELAFTNDLPIYQYPVTKAYEMTSCFEGLLEFYKVTKDEKYKTAIVNFADRILESDFTVIGNSGCTIELFDHSTVRQANESNDPVMQETCVVVTIMKFMLDLSVSTGNPKYVDAFECSLYNAYLGTVNTEKNLDPFIVRENPNLKHDPMPFDSYSPLTSGTRGNGIGGFKVMHDNHYYGCCACIGAMGIGLVPEIAMTETESGFTVNMYIPGTVYAETPAGNNIKFKTETDYPKNGDINIAMFLDAEEEFSLLLRNPAWSKNTKITINDEDVKPCDGYIEIHRKWKNGDIINLQLDMRTEAILPTPYGEQVLMNKVIWGKNYIVPTLDKEDPKAKYHIALRRGPLMLAVDKRLGFDADDAADIKIGQDNYVDVEICSSNTFSNIVEAYVPTNDGNAFKVTDYASAGKTWSEESKMAVWIKTPIA